MGELFSPVLISLFKLTARRCAIICCSLNSPWSVHQFLFMLSNKSEMTHFHFASGFFSVFAITGNASDAEMHGSIIKFHSVFILNSEH